MNLLRPLAYASLGLTLLTSSPATIAADNTASTAYRDVLSNPDRLQPQPGGDGALIWVDPKANFHAYDAVLIGRIRVRLAEDSETKDIDPGELKALTDYLHSAIVKALEPAYRIASKPGPGVLGTRIWVTELVPTKPEYSVATLVIPYATVLDLASGAAAGESLGQAPYLGRTGIAGELVDSSSGQVIAAYADGEVGRKYVVNADKGIADTVTTGVGDYLKAYSTWDYAKQAFDGWAQGFRAWLDAATGH